MLTITIPGYESYNDKTGVFTYTREHTIRLEHSLVSLSKWESFYNKPFLSTEKKTFDESVYYIKCMTLTQNIDDSVYNFISSENVKDVSNYIEAPMTATTFANIRKATSNEIITAELIYYWMVALNIPFECQKWHLARLFVLVEVCNIKNSPNKKVNPSDVSERNKKLNDERRAKMHSKG